MKYRISFINNHKGKSLTLIWLTDLHLDAVAPSELKRFKRLIASENPDILLIGGDIANGLPALEFLCSFVEILSIPIYFVLGNHDYYFLSVQEMRSAVNALCEREEKLCYLTQSSVISLTENTALIGHDGWADAKAGNFSTSTVVLNDYLYINDLKNLTREALEAKLHQFGEDAAATLKKRLVEALTSFQQVLILTHSPPFEEVCLYREKQADANWAPHFVCQSVGSMLREVVKQFTDREVIVLCGHSHHKADQRILPNLRAFAGHSNLGVPIIQGVITLV